jgi:hypothetical protein
MTKSKAQASAEVRFHTGAMFFSKYKMENAFTTTHMKWVRQPGGAHSASPQNKKSPALAGLIWISES